MENSGIYDQEGWSSIITLHKVYWGWTDRLVMWGADDGISSVFTTTTTSIFLPLLLACYSVFSPSHSQPSDVTSGTTTTTTTVTLSFLSRGRTDLNESVFLLFV